MSNIENIFNKESKAISTGQHETVVTGVNLNKLENYLKSQGIKDPEAISEIKKGLIDKLQENNDIKQSGNKVTVDGKGNVKFNNKDGENNNISPEDVKGFINEKVDTFNKAKEAIENNSEVTNEKGNPKVTFNLKTLKEDLTNLGKEKLQQVGDKLKEFGDKAKQFISDMSDKIKGFIGGLIEGLFGKKDEKTTEPNKAEDKTKDKEPLNIKKDDKEQTATVEGKEGFSAKDALIAIGKLAYKIAIETAKLVGKVVGAVVKFGKELANAVKEGYQETSQPKESYEKEFAKVVDGMGSQKESTSKQATAAINGQNVVVGRPSGR